MIGIKTQTIILALVVFLGLALITSEPPPGPSITVVKTKQLDARDLIK